MAAFALAIGFSPLHIVLLLLLLLGPNPLRRGGLLVLAWMVTAALALTLLLTAGHGLLLTMDKGTSHRTGLDLLAAGALLALGLKELLTSREEKGHTPAWASRLDQFCAMALPPLLLLSALLEVASPDDLFLFAKSAGTLLAAHLAPIQELGLTLLFSLVSAALLLVPLLAVVLLGQERVLPTLQQGKQWMLQRGDALVGVMGLAVAVYLGWQGIDGLRLS
ncbi:MAG: GAP family protein [Cyanobacteria bacterium M_surface_7_m2_040]|nr:GAP family protein [Cyanobacteria bacterium M_surface_7_m2_040]